MKQTLSLSLLALALLAAPASAAPPDALTTEVRTSLEHGVEAWNRGDLDAFMKDYLHSPDMTFTAGGRMVRGYDALQSRYQQTYGTSKDSMGHLMFDNIEVTPLGPDNALAVGHWMLDAPTTAVPYSHAKPTRETLQGVFSLVLRKTSEGWKIIHDHTSRMEKK